MESKFTKQAEQIQTAQIIERRVLEYLENKKNTFVEEQRKKLQKQFSNLKENEENALLTKYSKPGLLFHNMYSLRDDMIEMPEQYIISKQETFKSNSDSAFRELLFYQNALKVPVYYRTAECALSILPEKNEFLALQVINRLAREYQVRFEDIDTVLKEVLC